MTSTPTFPLYRLRQFRLERTMLLSTSFGLLLSSAVQAQAPTVTTVVPARNAVAAPRTTPVAVSFSQPLSSNAATLGALKVFSQQTGGLKAGTTSVSGNTLTLTPTTSFKPGETVFATVTGAAQSSNGTAAMPHVFQFTTATAPAPALFSNGFYLSEGSFASALALGDVDGDGDLDLVTSNNPGSNTTSSVVVRRNNGTGSFVGTQAVNVGPSTGELVLGDVDGDGDLDLLSTPRYSGTSVYVRLNDGTGSFSGTGQVAVGSGPTSLTLGDVDGDGDLDLVTGNGTSGTVSVRFNQGAGSFSGGQDLAVGSAESVIVVTLGDVDADGDLDLVTTNGLHLNNGGGSFGNSTEVGLKISGSVLGDLDGDGDLDWAMADRIRLNNGSGSFSSAQQLAGPLGNSTTNGPTLGDVDGDGDLDLLASGTLGRMNLYLNNGSGGFGTPQQLAVGSTSSSFDSPALGDVDGDGTLDLLTANNTSSNTVSVRLNSYHVLAASAPALTAPLSVFPNPSPGRCTLTYAADKAQPTTLLLTDALGRVVHQQTVQLISGTNQVSVEATSLSAGFYQLTLQTSDGQRLSQKLLVQP